jgi:general secretion pathway protein D
MIPNGFPQSFDRSGVSSFGRAGARRASVSLALALLLCVLAGSDARAQTGEPRIEVNIQNRELVDVIKLFEKSLGRTFLYDDRVRGQVTIQSQRPVTLDEGYKIFESILQLKGFSIVDGPAGIGTIIPTREAPNSPIPIELPDAPTSSRDNFVTRLVSLKYVKVDSVIDTFRMLASKDAKLIAYAPTNLMILTDTAANIRRALTIVDRLDVAGFEEQVKVIPIEYADAADLVEQLREIFSPSNSRNSDAGGGSASIAAARARAAARAAAAAATTGQAAVLTTGMDEIGAAGEPRFIPDARTNSIIVLAPQATIRQVESLITLLDYNRPGTGRINIIRLQNADAEEIAETLAALVGGGSGGGAGAAGPAGTPGAGGAAGPLATPLPGGIKITADAPTNSLIVEASPEGFAALQDVIAELDTRRPQVLIEALVMEVNITDGQSFGTQILFNTLLGGGDNPVRRLGGFGSDPVRAPIPVPPLGGFSGTGMGGMGMDGATTPIPALTAPFTGTLLGKTISIIDQNGMVQQLPIIQAAITAAANNSDMNVINTPQILTADNEEAQIVVGTQLGFPTSNVSAPLQSGGAGSPFQTSQNVERRDVGVTLRVTPQISEGDTVKLDFFQEVSSVAAGNSNGSIGPVTTNRSVENTVFVRDGEAVMIGGIIQDQLMATETKVPFLGDLPIFGFFFRQTSDQIVKTNLIVLLTPYIVRDPRDLQEQTIRNRERFRSLAGSSLSRTDDELEARRKAIQAGVDLPLDDNPVRREIDGLTRRYPTESLPELQRQREKDEATRRREVEASEQQQPGGRFQVQVAMLRDANAAATLLQKLMDQGYSGSVMSRTEAGSPMYFVQLGPYPNQDEAQRIRREVSAATGLRVLLIVDP